MSETGMQPYPELLVDDCIKQELEVAWHEHHVACQELAFVRDKHDHLQQYHAKDEQEVRAAGLCLRARTHAAGRARALRHCAPQAHVLPAACRLLPCPPDQKTCKLQRHEQLGKQLRAANVDVLQLKLDGLRQRKHNSILRLKLACAKEDLELLQREQRLLDANNQRLRQDLTCLREQLADTTQQLGDVLADRAAAQTQCAHYQVCGVRGVAAHTPRALSHLHPPAANVPNCSPCRCMATDCCAGPGCAV